MEIERKNSIQNEINMLGKLPSEVAYKILMLLELKDLSSCWYTCTQWRNLMSRDYFWKLAREKGSYMDKKIFLRSKFGKMEDYWQLVYNFYIPTHGNWKKGLFEEVNYFQYDFQKVVYLDDELVVGYIKTTKDIDSYRFIVINHLKRNVQGKFLIYSNDADDPKRIVSIGRYKNFLVSYITAPRIHDFDRHYNSISVINLNNMSVFTHYPVFPTQVAVYEHFIATVSDLKDFRLLRQNMNYLRIYNIKTNVIEYECPDVIFFGITNGKLAMLKDNLINVVDLKNGCTESMLISCKKVLRASMLLTSNTSIILLCSTGHVCCWCPKTEREIQHFSITFDEYYEGVVYLHNDKLIYYNIPDKTTEVWNVLTGNRHFVIKKLFYVMDCNSRFMVGIDVGEQKADVRCLETGKLFISHANGINVSEYYALTVIKLFNKFIRIRHSHDQREIKIAIRKSRLRLMFKPEILISETCCATTIIKKKEKRLLDFFRKTSKTKTGISVLDFKGKY